MKARSILTAALVATFAAGASAAYLSEDLYGTSRQPAVALQADEGVPQNLVALKADEGVPQNLVALKADEGVPQNLVALKADEGVPQNLGTARRSRAMKRRGCGRRPPSPGRNSE